MNYWKKNLEALKHRAPELAETLARTEIPTDHQVLPSKEGAPSLKVGREQLHSPYDPRGERLNWVRAQDIGEAEPLVIFGLGLGYHVVPLLAEGREVWVVEPSAAVARLALEHQDLSSLWAQGGLCLGRDSKDIPPGARLLTHSPSRRLHPDLYKRLMAHLAGETNSGTYLRILVVGPLYGGSHPIAHSCARAFRSLGHKAELLDFAPFYHGYQALQDITTNKATANRLTQDLLQFLGEILLAQVRNFRPDLVFFLAQAPVDPRLLRQLRSEGPLLAYWFVEDFQVFPYWRDLASEVDVFFTRAYRSGIDPQGYHTYLPLVRRPLGRRDFWLWLQRAVWGRILDGPTYPFQPLKQWLANILRRHYLPPEADLGLRQGQTCLAELSRTAAQGEEIAKEIGSLAGYSREYPVRLWQKVESLGGVDQELRRVGVAFPEVAALVEYYFQEQRDKHGSEIIPLTRELEGAYIRLQQLAGVALEQLAELKMILDIPDESDDPANVARTVQNIWANNAAYQPESEGSPCR